MYISSLTKSDVLFFESTWLQFEVQLEKLDSGLNVHQISSKRKTALFYWAKSVEPAQTVSTLKLRHCDSNIFSRALDKREYLVLIRDNFWLILHKNMCSLI